MNIIHRVFGKRTTTQIRVPKTIVLRTRKLRKGDQRMPRMRTLSTQEQEDFDRPPVFSYAERKQIFSLPKSLLGTAQKLRTPNSQIGFLLMCGYFRASKRFFLPRDFHERDIEAVARILELSPSDFIPSDYVKTTRFRHQKIILDFYGFRLFDAAAEQLVRAEIATMVRSQLKPKLIFERCLDLLIQNRMTLPHSNFLTALIRAGLKQRRYELNTLVDAHLPPDTRQLLDDLFGVFIESAKFLAVVVTVCLAYVNFADLLAAELLQYRSDIGREN